MSVTSLDLRKGDKEGSQIRQPKESQLLSSKKIASLKALLKEEDPQKLTSVIEKIEGCREQIDEYISRITGISIKIITVTRNWRRIIKKIIIEEGKEALDYALKELERELILAEEAKRSIVHSENGISIVSKADQKIEHSKQKVDINSTQKPEVETTNINMEAAKLKGSASNTESIVTQEVEYLKRKLANSNKIAVEILFMNEQLVDIQEASRKQEYSSSENSIVTRLENNIASIVNTENESLDLAQRTEDLILEDIENAPLGTSQTEVNNSKVCWNKQIKHAAANYKELHRTSLEDSVWAPNETRVK